MMSMQRRINWPAWLLLAVVVALVAHSSRATRGPAAPGVMATVNLEEVFQGLAARTAADAELTELAKELDARGQAQRDEIEVLKADLELYPVGSKQYQEASQDLARRSYQLQAFLDFAMRKLDLEKSITLRRLYAKIKAAAAELAAQRGYDVVFVDDSIAGLPADLGEAETMRQISARRMLFAGNMLDVTDELITFMNEQAP